MDPTSEETPPGFRSAASKRALTRAVWVSAVLVGLVQLVAPLVLLVYAFIYMFINALGTPIPEIEAPAVHDERVWYTARPTTEEGEPDPELNERDLLSVSLHEEDTPQAVTRLTVEDPQLIEVGSKLYAVGRDGLAVLEDTKAVHTEYAEPLPSASRPIVIDERLAIVTLEHDYDAESWVLALAFWEEGDWKQQWSAHTSPPIDPSELQVAVIGSTLHVFASSYFDPVFHATHADGQLGEWQKVDFLDEDWSAAAIGDVLVLAELDDYEEPSELTIWRHEGRWREALTIPAEGASRVGMLALDDERVAVLTDTSLDGFAVRQVQGDEIIAEHEHQASTLFAETIGMVVLSQLAPFLLDGLLVLFLSGRMRAHRITEYEVAGRTAHYASLTRRAIAKGIDSVLVAAGPLAILVPRILENSDAVSDIEVALVSVAFGLPFFFIFAALEGAKGWTPGKLLMNIRVTNMELERCGMGPGLMRGLLSIVDGMFGSLVGIIFVATGEHWQRLGDRVAKTLVIVTPDSG